MLTVKELKELIEDLDDDTEVRIAYQPGYPLEAEAGGAVLQSEVQYRAEHDADDIEDLDDDERSDSDEPDLLYVFAGADLGYASKYIFTE